MNDTMRKVIRQRMEELDISQSALARLISDARNDGKPVERVAINRALNHAGAGAPLMEEILETLGLELALEPVGRYSVYPMELESWEGTTRFESFAAAKTALKNTFGELRLQSQTNTPSGLTWHYQDDITIVRYAVDNLGIDYPDLE